MATKLGKIAADFTTSLASAIAISGTTATLQSATDDDGVALADGLYYFAVDGGNSQKEFWQCTKTGVNLTAIQSVSRQGALTSGSARAHRIGATVALTDFAYILFMQDLLSGTTMLNSATPLEYDGTATITTPNQLTTKAYVDAVAITGAPNASTSVQGLVQEATQAQVDARTVTGGTGAKLFAPLDKIRSTKYHDGLASTGTTDAYVLTVVPAITAYALGQEFNFIANFTNTTTTPTLNVSGIGAKTLININGTALKIGDIVSGQAVKAMYDGTNLQMMTTGSGPYPAKDGSLITGVHAADIQATMTAGETITAGNPLFVTSYSTDVITFDAKSSSTGTGAALTSNHTTANQSNRLMVVATTTQNAGGYTITSITYNGVALTQIGSGASVGGSSGLHQLWYLLAPATGTNTLTVNSSNAGNQVYWNIHTFYNVAQTAPEDNDSTNSNSGTITATSIPLTNGSIVFGSCGSSGTAPTGTAYSTQTTSNLSVYSGYSGTLYPVAPQSISVVTGGSNCVVKTATWYPVQTALTTRVYKTSALSTATTNTFVGFAAASATVGNTVTVTMGGVTSNQSSLTQGVYYYLGDTPGTIGTTVGTVTRKVGISLSATELLITNNW